jgi:hypothetical protein
MAGARLKSAYGDRITFPRASESVRGQAIDTPFGYR